MAKGYKSFAFHADRKDQAPIKEALRAGRVEAAAMLGFTAAEPEDPASIARRYLDEMLASNAAPEFEAPAMDGLSSQFRLVTSETMPLTRSTIVKFRQIVNKIPVYGSLVTVELDGAELLSINSSLGEPVDVDCAAAIAPAQALEVVRANGGAPEPGTAVRTVIYKDGERWRLVYLLKDVPVAEPAPEDDRHQHGLADWYLDFIVDAHDGKLIAKLPRTANAGMPEDVEIEGLRFRVMSDPPRRYMFDPRYNVHTHDFGYADARFGASNLPGAYCEDEPHWSVGRAAHANATIVMAFLDQVLQRRGLDNAGGPLVSSVNCTYSGASNGKEWRNAAWNGRQMIYGQRKIGDSLTSYSIGLDVVAHEVIHGLTAASARLEYSNEPGALNESYSDIFGIIIFNRDRPVREWDWRLGEEINATGLPLRDLSDPTTRRQPAHMRDYLTGSADHGGVHTNSGIHNKAAYLLISAKRDNGDDLFDARDAAAIFYLALTQQLTRTSGFADSRRALEVAARSFFRDRGEEETLLRVKAINEAFDAVGVG